jgi:hypothetical protein
VPGDEQPGGVAAERLAAAGGEERVALPAATLVRPGPQHPDHLRGERGAAFPPAAHDDLALPPADVARVQAGDLPGPQAQPRQQHQDREVPAACRAVPVQLPVSRASPAGLTARGSAASCQHAADGTAPVSGALTCPSR